MNIIDVMFSYTVNLFSIYLNIRILKIFLPEKNHNSIVSFVFYLAICTINWLTFALLQIPNLTTILLFLLLLSLTYYQFRASFFKKLVAISISIGLSSVAEGIVWHLSNYTQLLPFNDAFCTILPCFLNLGLLLILENMLQFNKSNRTPMIYNIQIIFIAISSIALCDILISNKNLSPMMLSAGFCIICLINIFSLVMYDQLNNMVQQQIENKALEQRILMYQNQFKVIQTSQTNMRSLRHDLHSHLILIEKYIRLNHLDVAIQYIESITQVYKNQKEYVSTGNEEVDCVLNYLLEHAKQIGSEIQTTVEVPKETFMPALDLNILISNLLTNAIEAIQKSNEKHLNVSIKYDRNILYISIYNTFQGKLYKTNRFYATTKKNKALHGYGFKNIQSIIEKYDGDSSFRTENNIFKADIILYLKSIS